MRKFFTRFYILFFCGLCCHTSFATVYRSLENGNWKDASTWDASGVPTSASDTVIIDGHSVTLDNAVGDITIKTLIITNASGQDNAILNITDDVELTVKDEVLVQSFRFWDDVKLRLFNNAKLFAQKDLTFFRSTNNDLITTLQLDLSNYAQVHVGGNFTFDFGNSSSLGLLDEVILNNSSLLNVTGDVLLYSRGGKELNFELKGTAQALIGRNFYVYHYGGKDIEVQTNENALLQIDGSLYIENNGGTNKTAFYSGPNGGYVFVAGDLELKASDQDRAILFEVSGDSSKIEVLGNITLDALTDGDIVINLQQQGSLAIGGNFERVDNSGQFGSLTMSEGGQLIYNGTSPQIIACDSIPSAGLDGFSGDNVKLDNPSGFILEGPVVVYDSLVLTDGIISTDASKSITFADGAIAKGGSASAFIDGPVIKRGTTNGNPFIFPTGDIDPTTGVARYMPIEISTLGNALDEYTAQYYGCPPPYINSVDAPIDHISSEEFWTLSRTPQTVTEVTITLHWTDAATSGIDDPSSLVVASDDPVAEKWTSIGNGGITLDGATGTLMSDIGCPPPYINRFTFASVLPTTNALPVELLRFTAQKTNDDQVKVEWLTGNEVNSDYFAVERSINGRDFEKIGILQAAENSRSTQYYTLMDQDPGYGQNYYRLMQVDRNGDYNFSRVISVNFALVIGDPIIYPNPVADRINIQGNSPLETEAQIDLYTQNGQLIYTGIHPLYNGNLSLNAATANLVHPGQYFLKMRTSSSDHTLSLL
ncbi:MAG: T9SS type A sorting domain-containing protein, partial [Bacteroidota bacterium]